MTQNIFKNLVLNLKFKNDLFNIIFSALPLTEHNFKNYFKGEDRAITPQGTKAATLSLSPNIFNNEVAFIEINWELKNKNEIEEDSS